MATTPTETSERDDTARTTDAHDHDSDHGGGRSLPGKAISQVRNGRIPLLAGSILAARGLRDLLSKQSGGLLKTATGLGLLGFGLRQRAKRKSGGLFGSESAPEESLPGMETVAIRSQANEPGTNPRDVDDEPDVASERPDEGSVQFETEDSDEPERKPHLDDVDPKDPRYPDEGDPETDEGHVDVDISEDALADEPNEAVGPDEEQAFPASEGTDPEPTSPAAPERSGEETDADEHDDSDADEEERSADESDSEDSEDEDLDESL